MTDPKKEKNVGDDTTSEKKLRKASPALCKSCKYHIPMGANALDVACYYIIRKRRSRLPKGAGEEWIGWCDKYERGRTEPDKWAVSLKEDF